LLFAAKNFSAPASGKVRLDLTLSPKVFELLQNAGRIKVNATVTLKSATGSSRTATKPVTFSAPAGSGT
jgi:hypothetical protein